MPVVGAAVLSFPPWILALVRLGRSLWPRRRRRARAGAAAEREPFPITTTAAAPPPPGPAAPRCLRCSAESPQGAALCARCSAQTENPGGFVLVVLHPRLAKVSKVGWVSDEHLLTLTSTVRRFGARKDLLEWEWTLDRGGVDALVLDLRRAGLAVNVRRAPEEDSAAALLKVLMSLAPLGGSVREGNELLMRKLNVTDRQVRRLLDQLIERRQLHRSYSGADRVLTPYPEGDAPPSQDQQGRTSLKGRTSTSGQGGRRRPPDLFS